MAALPLWLQISLIWWLLICARQDWRTRHVANWLTVPPFLAALPAALWLAGSERLVLTLLILACVYTIWTRGGMGAADGKIATVLAATVPASLVLGLALLWLMYGALHIRRHKVQQELSLPGVVGLFLGLAGWLAGPWSTGLS